MKDIVSFFSHFDKLQFTWIWDDWNFILADIYGILLCSVSICVFDFVLQKIEKKT